MNRFSPSAPPAAIPSVKGLFEAAHRAADTTAPCDGSLVFNGRRFATSDWKERDIINFYRQVMEARSGRPLVVANNPVNINHAYHRGRHIRFSLLSLTETYDSPTPLVADGLVAYVGDAACFDVTLAVARLAESGTYTPLPRDHQLMPEEAAVIGRLQAQLELESVRPRSPLTW